VIPQALPSLPGALVVSLDFELQWGVRDRMVSGAYRRNLEGAREAIPRILELFREFDIAATWATVGFLFAESRDELRQFSPAIRPGYSDRFLDPYDDRLGVGEADDPLHFAPSLVDAIRRAPRQELASHTFSHYYCHEPGQTAEAFRADLQAACAIALAKGTRLRSIVFPRNQRTPAYDAILCELGFTAYRGNPNSWMWRFQGAHESASPPRRLARAWDTFFGSGHRDTVPWSEVLQPSGLSDVRASLFLAPFRPWLGRLESARLRRIRRGIRAAAERRELFHLWWHPHNFGAHVEENLRVLRGVLTEFDRCRARWGMESLSMASVADLARAGTLQPIGGALRRTASS
jgi:peptidoglycan/xylan/chitin deacetylase (PgdA/CDA1 family)